MDGFFSQIPYKFHLEEVESVGDWLKFFPQLESRVVGFRVQDFGFGVRFWRSGFRVEGPTLPASGSRPPAPPPDCKGPKTSRLSCKVPKMSRPALLIRECDVPACEGDGGGLSSNDVFQETSARYRAEATAVAPTSSRGGLVLT